MLFAVNSRCSNFDPKGVIFTAALVLKDVRDRFSGIFYMWCLRDAESFNDNERLGSRRDDKSPSAFVRICQTLLWAASAVFLGR